MLKHFNGFSHPLCKSTSIRRISQVKVRTKISKTTTNWNFKTLFIPFVNSKKFSGMVMGSKHETLVGGNFRSHVHKELPTLLHCSYGPSTMTRTSSNKQQIICKTSWFNFMFFNMLDPNPRDKCNNDHGKWTPLWNGTSFMMNFSNRFPNLKPNIDVINVLKVCSQDTYWHSSLFGQIPHNVSVNLIKTFKYVDRPSSNIIMNMFKIFISDSRFEPSTLSSLPSNNM